MSIQDNIIELDIAIIGGGSSGMALATKLHGIAATVFEPKTAAERDCSWALWTQPPQLEEFSQSIQGSWNKWRIIDHSNEIIHHSNQYHYTCLSAEKHLKHCEANLKDPINLVRSPVENLVAEGAGGQFNAGGQCYKAKTIYDSRPPKMGENTLRQHFIGWEIHLKEPIENADIATLMDFRVDQSRGLHFIYVLPYSNHHLLVESTMISTQLEDKDWYRKAITGWLAKRNIQVQTQLREEYGVISMATEQPHNAEVNSIGANGGAVRLSSGYAFSTIQRQMAELAQSITRGERNVPKPFSRLLMFMDKVFNRALNAQPDQGVSFFMATAKALDGEQFSRFMLGEAGFLEWAKVMKSMPKWPFIMSALSQMFSHD